MQNIKAISFDLWDTVFADDSDEPKRKEAGLSPKPVARRELVYGYLSKSSAVERYAVDCAYDTADAAFRQVWYQQHVTWSVADRLKVVLAGLKRELEDKDFADLVNKHEMMELEISPDLVSGVSEVIEDLSSRYKLIVISDTVFSPGWALRKMLAKYELEKFFAGFVFSDEAGMAKPSPELFHRAAELAQCDIEQLVHLGDREAKDIVGPKAVGAKAILITASVDRGSKNTIADAVCDDYSMLPKIISSMDS